MNRNAKPYNPLKENLPRPEGGGTRMAIHIDEAIKQARAEVVSFIEKEIIYSSIELHSGKSELMLRSNGFVLFERWQEKLIEWGLIGSEGGRTTQ